MIDALFGLLQPWIRGVTRHPGKTALAALGVSALGLAFALNLRIDTDLAGLLPRSYPSVQALDRLRDTVGGESAASVIVQSPSFEANRAFAETLIPIAMQMQGDGYGEPYFVRHEYRKDVGFLERNALYFATDDELDELILYLKQQWARAQRVGLQLPRRAPGEPALKLIETYRDAAPTEFPVSDDSTTMVVRFYPSGSQTNLQFVGDLYRDLNRLVDSLRSRSGHPEMEVFVGGLLERQLIEVEAIRRDLIGSVGGGVAMVLLIVMLYFWYKGVQARRGDRIPPSLVWSELRRTPVAALLVAVPLAMSLTWTFGVAELVYGRLNLMTSMLVLVLFGLGVDYGIHYFARYTEERGAGLDPEAANLRTFAETGPAIAVSALTTAASLFVLFVADFKGFSQFGVIAGTGIVFAMLATLGLLPALLVLCEDRGMLRLEATENRRDPRRYDRTLPGWRVLLAGSVVLTLVMLGLAPRVAFEYRFSELEPEFAEHLELREKEGLVYSEARRNPAYIIVDNEDDVAVVTDTLRARMERDTMILAVESLQERYPTTPEEQQDRLDRIDEIRSWLDRPEMRILGADRVRRLRRAAETTEPITIDQVPRFLKAQFTSRTGELGNFVIVYPAEGMSDGRNSMHFSELAGEVTTPGPEATTYHAASTSIVAAEMMRLLIEESPLMILLTGLVLLSLLYVMFRSVRWSLLAATPLMLGVVWMLGMMGLFGVRLNFYNLVVLPAVLGIGVDGGVHIINRYRKEGRCCMTRILRSTGEHIAVGSLTTLVAFAWWLFSFHPGLNSIGVLAVIGISAVLVAGLVALPSLLEWLEARNWLKRKKEAA